MGHGHSHRHGRSTSERRLTIALVLAAVYMLAELVGGLLTGSLALLADAGHMLSDVGALALSLFALRFARRPSSSRYTYGYYRTEILAALANGAALIAISVGILLEAFRRIGSPPEVLGGPMFAIATGGLVVNLIGLAVLSSGRHTSLNVRGAWLHVMSDALGSVAAMSAGALVWGFGWTWADPVASLLIALFIVHAAWALVREAVSVLMESAPGHLDVDEIRGTIAELDCVAAVHDLHVWTITSGVVSLSCHAVKRGDDESHVVVEAIRTLLGERFGIDHVTVQVEPDDFEEPHGACEEEAAVV